MSINLKKENSSLKSSYRPEIDGLRAFAVTTVIINHFNKEILPGGYLGVDIFFVISGFVITSSLCQRSSNNFKDFISGFYERRIKRLVPALSVFVIITSFMICFFDPSPIISLKTGLTALFGLSNMYLFKNSIDYFSISTELNVFTHTWSLAVEEQFYILFPFLIWFSGFGRHYKNGARNLLLSVGTLSISSILGFLYLYPLNQPAAYYLLPSRFWEMSAGCLLFVGFQKRQSLEKFLEKIPPLLILGLIIGVMYLPARLAALSTFLVVLLACCLLASIKKKTAVYKIFTNSKVVNLGLISYSLYLWHWAVLSISRWTIGIFWWSIPFQISLMFILAIASYRWIETPLRKVTWFDMKWKTIVCGSGIIALTSGGVYALSEPLKGKFFLGKKSDCFSYQYETCTPIDYPHKATTPFIVGTKIQRAKCANEFSLNQGPLTKEMIINCTVKPSAETSPTVFLTGSSHSHHFSVIFDELRKEFGIGISMSQVGGCDLDPLLLNENLTQTCKDSNKNRISYIKNHAKEGDIIFTGVTPSHYLFDQNSLKEIVAVARNKKINIIFYTPIPIWNILKTRSDLCTTGDDLQWYRKNNTLNCTSYSEINRNIYEKKEEKILNTLKIFEESNSFFHVFPVHEFLCDTIKCPSHKNGIRLYRDNWGHLSIAGTKKYLHNEFRSFLLQRKLINYKKN